MTNKNVKLTELEAKTLRGMIADGYFWDDLESSFITWGVSGKSQAGCLTSLNKKGIVDVYTEDCGWDDTAVYCGEGWTKKELCEISGYFDAYPEERAYFES